MVQSWAEVMNLPGALSPYTVLEMGDHPSVAVLGMLLADQGANVIKVEPTTGDPHSWDARILRMEQGQAVRNGRPRYRRQPSQVPAIQRGRRYRELLLRREPL